MLSWAVTALLRTVHISSALLATVGLDVGLWSPQATLENNSSYDFIVVGAGTAGCVIARRLAEDKTNTVLVLEAGGDPIIEAMLPALFPLLPNSIVDYNYTSTPDEYAARSQNNHTMLTAGKMLGGSASLNHYLTFRGVAADYDSWAKLLNDESWNFENVLPYFKKSERVVDDEIIKQYGEYHGTEGPWGISRQLEDADAIAKYLESFAEADNPTVLDLNADTGIGYEQPQYMIADKKRQTPAYSYLNPIKDYSNLYVSKDTRVTKIIFENNVAVAVEAIYKGKTYTIRANKEIIISAGVYNTPQILMLSGIGPKEHLKTFNIDVLSDLPVGETWVDQVAVTLVQKVKKYLLPIPDPAALLLNPFKIPFPVFVGAAAVNKSQSRPDYHTYNLLFQHDTPFLTLACTAAFGFRHEICDRWQKQVISRDALYTYLVHLQPKSRGSVRLRSADPFDDPLITTGYFSKDEDLQDMLRFVKDFITVGDTKYFKQIGAGLVGLDLPECADKQKGSDEFWTCYILNHASSSFHASCSCPMGTVLDSKLKVKGVQNLRVVDASAIPYIPRAGPNAVVIMMAEKASDMIKSDNSS